ncbi:MAG: DUF4139 domain-containing protein [Fidelibacterota bacterium]
MRKILVSLFLLSVVFGQSTHATMTLYKDDQALIKQPVAWQLEPGTSTISYNILPDGIVKDSPFISLSNGKVLMQRWDASVFNFNRHLHRFLGDKIQLKIIDEKSITGILTEITPGSISIQRKREVVSISRQRIEQIITPGLLENVTYKPALTWKVQHKKGGPVRGNLVYLSKGFDWNVVYRFVLNDADSKGQLIAEAFVTNNSSLDFLKLTLQLVEGKLKQGVIPERRPLPFKIGGARSALSPTAPLEEQLGDYHIYRIQKPVSIKGGESITTRLYDPKNVTYEKAYLFENNEQSQKEEPLLIEYRIANSKKNNLGIPLPQGKIQVFQSTKKGMIEFVGEDRIRQVPKGGTAVIISGRAFDVVGKRTVLNYNRQQKSVESTISIEIKNSMKIKVKVRVIEHIYGDWVVRDASVNYLKKDASTISFPVTVKGNGSQTITYTYRKEWQ